MTDIELLERVLEGGRAGEWQEKHAARSALDELLRRQYDWVTRLCLVEFASQDAAYDCVQEIMIQVAKSLSSFEGRSKFSTWMYTIVRRTIIAQKRKEWLKRLRLPGVDSADLPERVVDSATPSPEKQLLQKELTKRVLEAVRQLPEKQRHAVSFYYFENLPVSEGALKLNCSEASFKTHLFRARDRLKTLLPEELYRDILS